MIPQQHDRKSKFIYLYILLFIFITSINNKNFHNKELFSNNLIFEVNGLSYADNQKLKIDLININKDNIFKLDKNKIGVGFLYTVISNNGFVIEPVFFTPDSIDEIHKEVVEDGILKNIECFEDNPVARGLTNTLRYELFDLFEDIGGVHMQIGKSYNFRKGLNIESWNVIENIKHIVDPNGLINPGSLGLNLGDDHN